MKNQYVFLQGMDYELINYFQVSGVMTQTIQIIAQLRAYMWYIFFY